MRQYLTDKQKKIILEEYIIEQLNDIQSPSDRNGMRVVGVDIAALTHDDHTSMSITYEYDIQGIQGANMISSLDDYESR